MTFEDNLRTILREVVREELRTALAEQRPAPPASISDKLVGVAGAAANLGISRSTIYKLAEKCELPSVKVGRRLLFRPADLEAFAEKRRRSPELVARLAASGRR